MIFLCSNFRCILVPFMQGYIWVLIYLESIVQQVSCSNPPYPSLICGSYSGMSALMRKELLDNAGGIQTFGCYLAEDFFFAKSILVRKFDTVIDMFTYLLFQEQNYKLAISTQPAAQNSGNASVSNFQNRISRYFLPWQNKEKPLLCKLYSSWISLLFVFDK